jgi:putative aminopeptidase FrvX
MRKPMAVPDLLRALLTAAGPSGRETEAAGVWREAGAAFAEVGGDSMGNSFARVRSAGDGAPTLALVGHIDEIGVAVTNIDDDGLLSFTAVGGVAPDTLYGQRLELLARGGRVPALVGRKRIYVDRIRDRPKLELEDLHLDIGATSREEAEKLVSVGDVGVWVGAPLEFPNGRLASKSLDNRLGAYIALETARRVAEAGDAQLDVVAVAAVQEEIGPFGARAAAFGLEPAVAVAIDVTPATDYPGGEPKRAGKIELGTGAMIGRGATLNPRVSEALTEAAEAEGIPHAFEVYSDETATDADEFHLSRTGVPTGLVSIPTRYLHSPIELCSLSDVEAIVQLLTAFARRVPRDDAFAR